MFIVYQVITNPFIFGSSFLHDNADLGSFRNVGDIPCETLRRQEGTQGPGWTTETIASEFWTGNYSDADHAYHLLLKGSFLCHGQHENFP